MSWQVTCLCCIEDTNSEIGYTRSPNVDDPCFLECVGIEKWKTPTYVFAITACVILFFIGVKLIPTILSQRVRREHYTSLLNDKDTYEGATSSVLGLFFKALAFVTFTLSLAFFAYNIPSTFAAVASVQEPFLCDQIVETNNYRSNESSEVYNPGGFIIFVATVGASVALGVVQLLAMTLRMVEYHDDNNVRRGMRIVLTAFIVLLLTSDYAVVLAYWKDETLFDSHHFVYDFVVAFWFCVGFTVLGLLGLHVGALAVWFALNVVLFFLCGSMNYAYTGGGPSLIQLDYWGSEAHMQFVLGILTLCGVPTNLILIMCVISIVVLAFPNVVALTFDNGIRYAYTALRLILFGADFLFLCA